MLNQKRFLLNTEPKHSVEAFIEVVVKRALRYDLKGLPKVH